MDKAIMSALVVLIITGAYMAGQTVVCLEAAKYSSDIKLEACEQQSRPKAMGYYSSRTVSGN